MGRPCSVKKEKRASNFWKHDGESSPKVIKNGNELDSIFISLWKLRVSNDRFTERSDNTIAIIAQNSEEY